MDLSSVHHHGCSMVANAASQRAKESAGKQEDAREGDTPLDTEAVRRTGCPTYCPSSTTTPSYSELGRPPNLVVTPSPI